MINLFRIQPEQNTIYMSVQSNIESGATEKVWERQQPQRSGGAVWEEGRVRIRDHDGQNFGVMFLTEYTDEAGPNDWEQARNI